MFSVVMLRFAKFFMAKECESLGICADLHILLHAQINSAVCVLPL